MALPHSLFKLASHSMPYKYWTQPPTQPHCAKFTQSLQLLSIASILVFSGQFNYCLPMPARPNSLSLSLILLLVSSLFFTIEARTLNAAKDHISIDKKIVKVFDESYIEDIETRGLRGEIKNSGATSVLYIGDIKIGGPSAVGKGGELVTDPPSPSKINDSGPSPGDGH